MYKFLLTNDTNFDFYLTKDEKEYKRNYGQYEIFNIDVMTSLYSTTGVTQSAPVNLKHISLTGFDNAFLGINTPQQYEGLVVANSYNSYTLSGDTNRGIIGTNLTNDYPGYTGDQDLLIEFKFPVIKAYGDYLYFQFVDSNNENFGIFMESDWLDSTKNSFYIVDTVGNYTYGIITSGDTVSCYVSNNTAYMQINGITVSTYVNTGATPDYSYEIRAQSNISGVTYTVRDLSVYFQKITYTGVDGNVTTDLNPHLTGTTYDFGTTKFKLLPVGSVNPLNDISYEILSRPTYKQLMGGFYQGFFKLYEYPVEYFKTRANKGWSVNMLAVFNNEQVTGTTLNDAHSRYPITKNAGMLFYLGTRAENKYLYITGDTIVNQFGITDDQPKDFTGQTISQINTELNSTLFDLDNLYTNGGHLLLNNDKYKGFYNITNGIYYTGRTYDGGVPLTIDYDYDDVINNVFGIFIYNGKIGYRSIYATDPCYTGATQDPNNIGENTFSGYTSNCSDKLTVSKIITKKFTVEQVMSSRNVVNLSVTNERFVYLTVVFERDVTYKTDCDLKYGKYKNGTLKIFMNGSLVFKYDKFTEIIPHELDAKSYLQEGVPFNISFGGGSQGLTNMNTFTNVNNIPPSVRLIDKFFSYSFIGGVRRIQMFMTPLDVTEINKEFNKIKDTYDIFGRTGGRFTYYRNNGY